MSNLDEAWELLDRQYRIVERVELDGAIELSAADIHEMRRIEPDVKFEPRLLTHFDNKRQQPALFLDNDISILPVKRGSYVLGSFDPFQEVCDYNEIETTHLPVMPLALESARSEYRVNEEMGLNYAYAMGILSDFAGEALVPTVWGRHSSGCWDYKIRMLGSLSNYSLQVRDSQIEVDGGYEGRSALMLVEAKSNVVSEFCLRQLYFPYRTWLGRVGKSVRPVFAVIDGDELYLFEYGFPDSECMEATLVKSRKYIVDESLIARSRVREIHDSVAPLPEPQGVPFPQANTPALAIDIVKFIGREGEASKDDIARFVGFDSRQSDYYGNALRYFGLATRKREHAGPFVLTDAGERFCQMGKTEQKIALLEVLMSRAVFREAYELYCECAEVPTDEAVMGLMAAKGLELEGATPKRRASTVRNWIRWISELSCG